MAPRFVNRDDIDFGNVEGLTPVQEWVLAENDIGGDLEYPTQYVHLVNRHSL